MSAIFEKMGRVKGRVERFRSVVPLGGVGVGMVAGVIAGSWWWLGGLGLLLALLLVRQKWLWRVLVCSLFAVVWLRVEISDHRALMRAPGSESVSGMLELGVLEGVFREDRAGWLWLEGEERRRVRVLRASDMMAGGRYDVKGRFFVPSRSRNPGVFSLSEEFGKKGIEGGLVLRERVEVGTVWWMRPLGWAEGWREWLKRGIVRGLGHGSDGRVVIEAMVLGEKPAGDSAVSRAFRESGTMHVFAVSGLHVGMVGVLVWLVLRWVPLPRRVGVFFVIGAMVAYALLTGLKPPVVRATLMGVCLLGAYFFRRRPSFLNALAMSLILVVFWAPLQVRGAGFQLSYGVILAIGLGVGLTRQWTEGFSKVDEFMPIRLLSEGQRSWLGVRRWFGDLLASSIAAWGGSLPSMWWHFGIVTPVSVIASVVVIPLTGVVLGLAFLAAFCGLVSPRVGGVVNRGNELVAMGVYGMVRGFSEVPGGHWEFDRGQQADWVVFDCGDGGAASFLGVEGGAMVDVGGRRFYREQLRGILKRWNLDVETVLVTHPDGKHVGALPELLEKGQIDRAVLPVADALSPSYREFLKEMKGEIFYGKRGSRLDLGDGVSVSFLTSPPEGIRVPADDRNLVMKVNWRGWRVLVTGDLGVDQEDELLASGVDLEADVILMGRHRWGVSGQKRFLEATGAKVVITSGARVPQYEVPNKRWFEMLNEMGVSLFDQSKTGAVMMDFGEKELRVKGYLSGDRADLRR